MQVARQTIQEYLEGEAICASELDNRAGMIRGSVASFMRGDHNLSRRRYDRLVRVVPMPAEVLEEIEEAERLHRARWKDSIKSALLVEFMATPAPCDACWRRDQCKRLGLGCDAFTHYVKRGRAWEGIHRIPSRAKLQEAMAL